MDEYTDLERGNDEYKKAFWLRVFTIKRVGSLLTVAMLMAGCACCVPVRVKIGDKYETYHAIFTMGMPVMVEEGVTSRTICPGMATRLYGDRHDNNHNIDFGKYLLISLSQGINVNTNVCGQNKRLTHTDDDGIYGGKLISIGGKDRIICRVYEYCCVPKPSEKCPKRGELVQYSIFIDNHTFKHHRYLLIYATARGIGTESLEYILEKLRSTMAAGNMERDRVNLEERCDCDHCFHRLMLISNSIYFCFLMDHTSNRCQNAKDWNYTLTLRKYFGGN